MRWRRKRLAYKDAVIVQKGLLLALADVPVDGLHQLSNDPDFHVSTSANGLEEVVNDLAHEYALVQVHVQR